MVTNDTAILMEKLSLGENGPRVVVKDCIDIAGCRTSLGSRAFEDATPAAANAEVVANLLKAGAKIVGKTNMHELAYGVTGINSWTGTPLNTMFPDRVPGGSSSGSAAAISAGMADFALGTDTGGSIRVPAACCGVTGFKPTYGRVSRVGVSPSPSSLDCVGPIADNVETIEQAMAMIDPTFVAANRPDTGVLGVVTCEADDDINQALDDALLKCGWRVASITLPSFVDAFNAGIALMASEMVPLFHKFCGSGMLGADVDARLQAGVSVTADRVLWAEDVRARFQAEVDAALANVDALVLPTLPSVPPLLSEAHDAPKTLRMTNLVRPFNVSGHPAISLPLRTQDNLPAGMQIVGRMNGDAQLCAIAAAVEKAL